LVAGTIHAEFRLTVRSNRRNRARRRAGFHHFVKCLLVPGIEAGLRGMRFINAAVASSAANAAWTAL
jgi:hypothetical protein